MTNVFRSTLRTMGHAWFVQRRKGLRERIMRDYSTSTDPEIREIISFVERHREIELPVGMVPPYEWVNEYRPENIRLDKDESTGMLFATIDGRRIFFPRQLGEADVRRAVSTGLMEQDRRSPHRYVCNGFNVDEGDIGVFIGASDGLFCASLIDRLSKAYLFEPDPLWHESLRATFFPWRDKVEVMALAVSGRVCDGQTTLDEFFKERPLPNYIQADIEGSESDLLKGAQKVLCGSSKLRLSICTYHKRLDFPRFSGRLSDLGYEIAHSPGFYFLGVRRPYLRRGVLYARRIANSSQ